MSVVEISKTDDLDAVLNAIRVAFTEQDGKIDPPSSMTTLTVLDIYKHLETDLVWGVFDGPALVACMFGTDKGDSLYLSKLSVLPDARGRGLAAQLFTAAEAHARRRRFDWLEVIARIELIQNHAMFERLGYVRFKDGRHPGYDRTTEIHFRKAVNS